MEIFQEGCIKHEFNKTLYRDFKVLACDTHLIWELTQGKVSLVDFKDFDLLKDYKWRAQKDRKGYYTLTGRNSEVVSMHTLIGGIGDYQVDHKNRDGLDNRRLNLRFATKEQQMFNSVLIREGESCDYRGVQLRKDRDLYRVVVRRLGDKRSTTLCHTKCPVEAAILWDSFMYEEYKNEHPLEGYENKGIIGEPTLNFIQFNFPRRLNLK